jgi:hypothetical protein
LLPSTPAAVGVSAPPPHRSQLRKAVSAPTNYEFRARWGGRAPLPGNELQHRVSGSMEWLIQLLSVAVRRWRPPTVAGPRCPSSATTRHSVSKSPWLAPWDAEACRGSLAESTARRKDGQVVGLPLIASVRATHRRAGSTRCYPLPQGFHIARTRTSFTASRAVGSGMSLLQRSAVRTC